MTVETMIYVYIAICASLIVYNAVYVFILSHKDRALDRNTGKYQEWIRAQMDRQSEGMEVEEEHIDLLCRRLRRIEQLTAFDKCMEKVYAEEPEAAARYLVGIYPVFLYLTVEYQKKDTVKTAYFPYIVGKYNILKGKEMDIIVEVLYDLLRSEDVYCRENALGAIYSADKSEYVIKALKIMDSNGHFHHTKLVSDGLLRFGGDRDELARRLWGVFDEYSVEMQVSILNFFRFGGIRSDEKMYQILVEESRNQELRFSCIRYFEKYPLDKVETFLQDLAENKDGRIWEYQSIATSALKSYPSPRTSGILKQNLSNSNWYVRLNAAVSCERLGFTYGELIQIFDGNDRYAREILRYRFDRRRAEEEAKRA